MPTFNYGTHIYEYELIKQERKTLSITVRPDLSIVVKAPQGATDERILQFLKKKWLWLDKQLAIFKKYQKKKYAKEYVSGESFYYLGKQYLLKVNKSDKDEIKLERGHLIINSALGSYSRKHIKIVLNRWFREERKRIFEERLQTMISKFDDVEAPCIEVRDMDKRWGSYSNSGRIILNPKLIHTSLDCIDYVITHELCHVKYKNHSVAFYKLLEQKFSTWEKTKDKLERYDI